MGSSSDVQVLWETPMPLGFFLCSEEVSTAAEGEAESFDSRGLVRRGREVDWSL